MRVFVGTSGWHYKDWDKRFYPQGLRSAEKLHYLAQYFKTVEVNSTFYNLPLAKSVQHWRAVTPNEFIFSIKMSQYVTHSKRLLPDDATREALETFYSRIQLLGPKLGCILVQLPPSMQLNIDRLRFLFDVTKRFENLNNISLPLAIEFRHVSWFTAEVRELLDEFGIMAVNNDSPNRWPATTAITAECMYIRFHGSRQLYRSSYTDEELAVWAERIREYAPKTVFAYFNNDYNAVAIENAQRFSAML